MNDTPRWIDAHSVTCAICGGLADERETIPVRDDPDSDMPKLARRTGEGEAHANCYEYARENGIESALNELEPIDYR